MSTQVDAARTAITSVRNMMHFNEPGITEHAIRQTVDALAQLADAVSNLEEAVFDPGRKRSI